MQFTGHDLFRVFVPGGNATVTAMERLCRLVDYGKGSLCLYRSEQPTSVFSVGLRKEYDPDQSNRVCEDSNILGCGGYDSLVLSEGFCNCGETATRISARLHVGRIEPTIGETIDMMKEFYEIQNSLRIYVKGNEQDFLDAIEDVRGNKSLDGQEQKIKEWSDRFHSENPDFIVGFPKHNGRYCLGVDVPSTHFHEVLVLLDGMNVYGMERLISSNMEKVDNVIRGLEIRKGVRDLQKIEDGIERKKNF